VSNTATAINTAQVRQWVADAGDIARGYFGSVEAQWKGVANPVTAADFEIEQLLSGHIRDTYPDHGIIGEEYGGEALDSEFIWAIDPIDGTRIFVEGMPTWSITLAVFHHLRPVFGLVYLPLLDDWTYTDGGDVFANGHVVTDRLKTRWDASSFVFWRSDGGTLFDLQFTRIMAYGSTATHMAYTARGQAVASIVHDTHLWDIAAGMAFMAAQGGEVRQLDGDLLDLTGRDLSAPILGTYLMGHPDVIARLMPLLHRRAEVTGHPAW
jgi:fructose-1,6-bisphosphatase/inositol monophosphatase family enzyme